MEGEASRIKGEIGDVLGFEGDLGDGIEVWG